MNALLIIFFLALIYVGISRFITRRFTDRKFMEEYKEKMKELNKEFAEASKRNDVKKMEEIHERQKKELLPGMKKLMKEQVKMLVIIFILFTLALYSLNVIDPTNKDDIVKSVVGSGNITIKADKPGIWRIVVKQNGRERASLEIGVGELAKKPRLNATLGKSYVWVDKSHYSVGENIVIHYSNMPKSDIVADRGTRAEIGIPFIGRIEGSYWVFIFFVIVLGLGESLARGAIEKLKGAKKVK